MEQPGIVLNIHGGTDKMLYKTFDMLDAGAAVGAVWCRDLFGVTRTRRGLLPRFGPEIDEALYPGLRDAVGVLRVLPTVKGGKRPLVLILSGVDKEPPAAL